MNLCRCRRHHIASASIARHIGLLALALASNSLPVRAESCFDEANPPSCSSEGVEVSEGLDVQNTCYILDRDFVYNAPFDLENHTKVLSKIDADSDFCQQARQAYHLCYWCTPNVTSDSYCFFRPDTCHEPPAVVDETVDINATCAELDAFAARDDDWPATMDLCYRAQQVTHLCPAICQDASYLGADSSARRKTVLWMARVSAFLSFGGACYILWNVLSEPKHRSTVYHQLLIGMACLDIVTACAWCFGTRPIPKEEGWYIEGARGNWSTCKAQAFFVQLGSASVFYNVSLASYYLLAIVYGWREGQLKEIRKYLHGGPLLVGLGLALGGIPAYDWFEYGCHLEPPSPGQTDLLWKVLVFAVIPIGCSIAFITVTMLLVYRAVRRQSRVSRKWSLGFGKSNPVEQRVFWQALFYTCSFYVTWPLVFSVYVGSADETAESYGFTLLIAFVAPLQGFNNFLVYIRPKLVKARPIRRLSTWFRDSLYGGRNSSTETQVATTTTPTTTHATSSSSSSAAAVGGDVAEKKESTGEEMDATMDPSVCIAQTTIV